jgi:diaminopimelate epimerase
MGEYSFLGGDIPVKGIKGEALEGTVKLGSAALRFACVNIGNPHCVVLNKRALKANALEYGPKLEIHPLFPKKINVQFVTIHSRSLIGIEIWERGAGYTLSSGSSSCAAACVCHRLGLCAESVSVRMPGGVVRVELRGGRVSLAGAVDGSFSGSFHKNLLKQLS